MPFYSFKSSRIELRDCLRSEGNERARHIGMRVGRLVARTAQHSAFWGHSDASPYTRAHACARACYLCPRRTSNSHGTFLVHVVLTLHFYIFCCRMITTPLCDNTFPMARLLLCNKYANTYAPIRHIARAPNNIQLIIIICSYLEQMPSCHDILTVSKWTHDKMAGKKTWHKICGSFLQNAYEIFR